MNAMVIVSRCRKLTLYALSLLSLSLPTQGESISPLDFPHPWTDESGATVKLSHWKNQVTVLTMSYTSCRRLCPRVTIQTLRAIKSYFTNRNIRSHTVVVTFDPENDTPSALRAYKQNQDLQEPDTWHFLSGDEAQTQQFAAEIGLGSYSKPDDHIIHDFKILIFSKNGNIVLMDYEHRDPQVVFKNKKWE